MLISLDPPAALRPAHGLPADPG